jgi:hypothetical protein
LEEQNQRQREAIKSKLPQEPSLIEQERQRQQREQNRNTFWNALGAGIAAGIGAYNAVPKNPQPLPSQPSYRRTKVQRPAATAPAPATTTHTNCPGNVAADENCRPLH